MRLKLFDRKPLQLHGQLFEQQPQRRLSDCDLDCELQPRQASAP